MENNLTIERDSYSVDKYVLSRGHYEKVVFSVDNTGQCVSVHGDWGPWQYGWGSIGSQTIKEFFAGCNSDYIMGKFAPREQTVPDYEGTAQNVIDYINDEALPQFLDAKEVSPDYVAAEGDTAEDIEYVYRLSEGQKADIRARIVSCDRYHLPETINEIGDEFELEIYGEDFYATKENPNITAFVERYLKPFQEHLKEEIANG